jgi:hypothetical protein
LCPWANRASWAEVCGVPREANAPTGGARESERLQYPEGVGLHGLCGAADGDRAQRACGVVVAAADLTVVVDILGNGVVGRPAGASVRCDGRRGDPPFDDHEGTVTAVAPAVDALGSVNVDQTSLRIGAFRRGPSPGRTTGRPRSQTPPRNASSVVAARCAAGRRAATQGIGMAAVTSDQSFSNEGRALSSRRRRRPRRTARPTAPPVRVGVPPPPVIPLAWAAVVTSARRGCR